MSHLPELKTKIEEFGAILQVVEHEAEEVEARAKTLDQFDFKLREREKKIDERAKSIEEKNTKVEMEREYIVKRENDLTEKEYALQKRERDLDEQKGVLIEVEKQRNQVKLDREALAADLKKIKDFEKEKQNIEHLRAMLERESASDRERKKLMNEQEAWLIKEKDRLQKIAEQIDTAK